MRKSLVACLIAGASLTGLVHAQQTEPAAPAASTPAPAPAPPKSAFTQGGMDFSFLFDGYVNGSYNHPDSGFNQYRNFDYRADTAQHLRSGPGAGAVTCALTG